ncbi:MAG: GNAT family N-acetyltransferase [Thermovirgaceae bacterium]
MSAMASAQHILSTCADIARRTGAFTASEIEVLREVLDEWLATQGSEYHLNLKVNEKDEIEGFILYGRAPMTRFAWDIYWIAVDADKQGYGIGISLIEAVQKRALRDKDRAVLRIETSGKPSYESQRRFYKSCGFSVAGRIPDFYAPGDDLVTFVKTIMSW